MAVPTLSCVALERVTQLQPGLVALRFVVDQETFLAALK